MTPLCIQELLRLSWPNHVAEPSIQPQPLNQEITHNDTESLRWHQSSFKLKLVHSSLHFGGDLKFRLGKLQGAKGRRVPQNPDQQAHVGVRCLFKIQQP